MIEVLTDAFFDSLKIFAFVFIINFIFSFFEEKMSKANLQKNKTTILFAALSGLLPQCGLSVAASEKYKKKLISPGTLLAIFIATSDEAIPVILSSPDKFYAIFPLLLIKFFIAVIAGYIFDFIFYRKNKNDNFDNSENTKVIETDVVKSDEKTEKHTCGCNHCTSEHNTFVKEHIVHPFFHSIKVFVIILVFNIIFSLVVYFVTEEKLYTFLRSNAVLAPFFSLLVGLIPNCASSVIISKLYITGSLSFGACISGLIANSGLGILVLFGKNCDIKNNLKIIAALLITGIISGYLICFIAGF